MSALHIEIHHVLALRVDANGRVTKLRVIGAARRDRRRIGVDVAVSDLDSRGADWVDEDQQATAYARIVDPDRSRIVTEYDATFHELGNNWDPAHAWVAEIDLLLAQGVPPLTVGPQQAPVHIRAYYPGKRAESAVKLRILDLKPVIEFDAGVLFVHGIGKQRRAETLSQWSAPLARWINAWLKGATDEVARKLQGTPINAWLRSLTALDFQNADDDYVDRSMYANGLARKVSSTTVGAWRPESRAGAVKRTAEAQPAPTDEEREEFDKVVCGIKQDIRATAVGGAAEFREAYVLDVGAHAFEPSSVEMHIEAMAPDGYMQRTRLMVAESHWAESFWAPSFFGFGRWCLLTAPVVLVHYIALARLQHSNWLRWYVAALGLTLGFTVAQLAFLFLMVLWLVPWERVRRAVLKVQLALAGIVGDAYVLLQDPVQRRAILDRVQRDLNWLLQRCRSVVVVAHSQGAAVAEIVLANRENEVGAGKIHSFVTLGSGVQTLTAIESLSREQSVNMAGWVAIALAYGLGIAGAIALAGAWPIGVVLGVLLLIGFGFVAWFACGMHGGRRLTLPKVAWFRDWLDFFATKDLVPYGPLLDPANKKDRYKPKEVRNRDSLLGDHVLYWQNAEQVVGPVAREIGAAAGFKPLTELLSDDAATLDRLERARLSRLDFLAIASGVALLASAVLLYRQLPALVASGSWAVVWLQSKLGLALGALPAPGLQVWLQAALVLLPFVVYKTLVNATFDAWTTAEVERLLRRSAGDAATHWALIFSVLVVLTLVGPIFYVWPFGTWIKIGATALGLMVVFFAVGFHHARVDAK
jgi:hypothetical protein